MSGLLDTLLGGLGIGGAPAQQQAPAQAPAQPPQALPSGRQWTTGPDGYITAVPNGGGASGPPITAGQTASAPAPGALVNQAAQQAPAAPSNQPAPTDSDPITVQGDSWKPKHTGILGQIADYLLGTHINEQTIRSNMEGALQHLNSDPQEAIRRMAEFNPQAAMELYSKVASEQHWNAMADRQSSLSDLQGAKAFMPMLAGMAQHVSTDAQGNPLTSDQINPQAWAAMKSQVSKIAAHYHMTPDMVNDMIPDTPDANVAQSLAAGSFPVYRQAALGNTERHQAVTEAQGQQNADANTSKAGAMHEMARNGAVRNAKYGQSVDQQGDYDQGRLTQGQEALDKKPGQARAVVSDQGHAGTISADGNFYDVPLGDGTMQRYIKVGTDPATGKTHWQPTHMIIGKTQ